MGSKSVLQAMNFDAGVEDPKSKPVKVVIYRREIVDIEVQKGAIFFPISLLPFCARGRG